MATIKRFKKHDSLTLPTLRGKIGDWFFYSTILSFSEIEKRVYLPREIDSHSQDHEQLGEWIQRELIPARTRLLVDYLNGQSQRFFNSLILGIYGGSPSFQEFDISFPNSRQLQEPVLEYLSRTLGILTLNGDEKIFAIDGQHRAIGIREAVRNNRTLENDEVSVIFLGHSTNPDGKIRTRRLFSTLNRYAKPVNLREIIALSEDDNCAIITRRIVEHPMFKDRILINQTRSINSESNSAFTNIITLYDLVKILSTDGNIFGQSTSGKKLKKFITERESDGIIDDTTKEIINTLSTIVEAIPSLESFFSESEKKVDRKNTETNLIFRPIGQTVIVSAYKIANERSKMALFLGFLRRDDFSLNNPIWARIFLDPETNTIVTEKSRQRYALLLILEALNIPINRTKKDQEIYSNFNIRADQVFS